MLDPEIRREVRREVRTFMNLILNCLTGESTTEDQEIDQVFPGAPKLAKRPVVHPYGLVSRAPAGKVAVSAQVGEHPGARILLGVRDEKRAGMDWLEEGEACLYSETGERIVLRKDKVQLGSESAANPVVLGTEMVDFLTQLVALLKAGQLVLTTSPGNPTAPNPAAVTQLEQLAQTFLTAADTNIISQRVFAERKKQ